MTAGILPWHSPSPDGIFVDRKAAIIIRVPVEQDIGLECGLGSDKSPATNRSGIGTNFQSVSVRLGKSALILAAGGQLLTRRTDLNLDELDESFGPREGPLLHVAM